MITLANMLRELAGLFVDDGALALAIIAVVAFAGMVVTSMPQASLAAGAVLLLGCLGVLFSSAVIAGRLD
jgi:hypothetical protein